MSSVGSAPNTALVASVIPLIPVWRVDRQFDYLVPPSLEERVLEGALVRIKFGNRKIRGVVVTVRRADDGNDHLESIDDVVVAVPIAPPPLPRLYEWVATRYVVPRGLAFARAAPPRVRVTSEPSSKTPSVRVQSALTRYRGGTRFLDAVAGGATGVWCIRPPSGADRTPLIAHVISVAAGEGAVLVTVPEIAYGATLLEELSRLWPGLARLDSSVSDMDRARGWLSMAGGAFLGGGGRAAVFAPARQLRLVIVDEEQHPAYKEERSPRYDARRVAVKRAQLQGALCVFVGSAPSVEAGAKLVAGEWTEVAPDRAEARANRPVIETEPVPTDRSIGRVMHERIREALAAGDRVALLATARGYARALWCADCRKSLRCPRCESGLTFDKAPRAERPRVRCTRCGFGESPPDSCPSCGATNWRFMGAGSERLEEQLAKAFPRAKVARVDPDTIAGGLEKFGDSNIYLTTWTGTKASIRPEVKLVGVLNADAFIRRSDFRSSERAYQALVELAGWAGPADAGGRLVIQTDEPAHYSIQALVRADYHYFIEKELEQRRELGYPPFSELIHVGITGPQAMDLARNIASVGRSRGGIALGPIARTGRGRQSAVDVLLKCRDAETVADGLRSIAAESRRPNRVRIDVDPVTWGA